MHDYLYIAWQDLKDYPPSKEDQKFADKLMLAAMKEAEVNRFKQGVIYLAVRTIGWWVFKGRNPGCRYVMVPSDSKIGDEPGDIGATVRS